MITIENYKSAYNYGIKDSKSGNYTEWYTPALGAMYDLGREGIEVDFEAVITGIRYGEMPESGISTNYREQISERGLSIAYQEGMEHEEIGSSVWFAGREKVAVRGILLPCKGSDGEKLILPLDIEQYDF